MPEKQFPWETIAPNWVYLLAFLAGFVGFLEEIKPEDARGVQFLKFLTRTMSSALAAVLTYQFLLAAGIPMAWHIPLTGVGAHMGTETLKYLGELWKRKVGIATDDKPQG